MAIALIVVDRLSALRRGPVLRRLRGIVSEEVSETHQVQLHASTAPYPTRATAATTTIADRSAARQWLCRLPDACRVGSRLVVHSIAPWPRHAASSRERLAMAGRPAPGSSRANGKYIGFDGGRAVAVHGIISMETQSTDTCGRVVQSQKCPSVPFDGPSSTAHCCLSDPARTPAYRY
jgi:hypothetical protein